jgi:hypothetical protein
MKTRHILFRSWAKTALLLLSTTTLLAATAVRADSPSDLMEQGIYSEETKGDLGAAVQLYQKVIAQAKSDQALAARAQYHLGVCYYKQQNFTDADAAFQSVIKDYPDQKDIVALARKYLAGAHPLQPVPWTDNEDIRLDLKLESGIKIGMADYAVSSDTTTNGQKIWRCRSHTDAAGISQSVSYSEVDAATLSPVHSYWKHTLLGESESFYYPDHVVLKKKGNDEEKTIDFQTPVIDNEEAVEWMRRLPLANGYKIDQPVFSSIAGTIVPVTWTVSGPENVTIPAGTYNCYKVDLSLGQTFWYTADSNVFLVKFEAGGAVAEMTGISHADPSAPVTYQDSSNGFSMTAPPGWIFDRQDSDKKGTTELTIVDPDGLSVSSLIIAPMSILTPEERKSVRAYAQVKLDKATNIYENFQTNTWKDLSVSGQPAVGVTASYTEKRGKKMAYGVWSFGPTNAVYFQLITSAKDFPTIQPAFNAIIDSFKFQ